MAALTEYHARVPQSIGHDPAHTRSSDTPPTRYNTGMQYGRLPKAGWRDTQPTPPVPLVPGYTRASGTM
ncbi:uncharacterized protein LOC62_03G004488 [Vanrija pseudolonga]|uniref:Uncharacterized protein n=1 Tax=Vanrija pseudolonga TaxID=143232 RepID=A0AAF0Y642_9TREE|nr:hypothetical protein LOC62_03G004488 [Vanrija pseudolonga]